MEKYTEIRGDPENPPKSLPKKGDLIPYSMDGRNQPLLYNGIQVVKPEGDKKPTAKDFKIENIPEE
jgi:hypothetical protein